jgi:ankyrin repeat protein
MLDNVLCARAMGQHSLQDMMSAVADVAILFKRDTTYLWTEYVVSRGFTEVHDLLLKLKDDAVNLSDSLGSLNATHELSSIIDRPDRLGRSPLAWAVEYGWADAACILMEFGADPNQSRNSTKGASPLLHLAIAGPKLGRSRDVVKCLLRAGIDINAKDHEKWTAVHVAASWGLNDIVLDLVKEHPDLSAITNSGHTAFDLAINSGSHEFMVAFLENLSCYGK